MMQLTLEMADRGVKAAFEKARELGTPMTISVVDAGGHLVLCARGDGTGFFSPDTTRAKAVAAAAFRRSTREMAELHGAGSAFWSTAPSLLQGQVLPSPGGYPWSLKGRSSAALAAAAVTQVNKITFVLKLAPQRFSSFKTPHADRALAAVFSMGRTHFQMVLYCRVCGSSNG